MDNKKKMSKEVKEKIIEETTGKINDDRKKKYKSWVQNNIGI